MGAVALVAAACSSDSPSTRPSDGGHREGEAESHADGGRDGEAPDSSPATPAELLDQGLDALEAAEEVDVWAGDFDDDGESEVLMVSAEVEGERRAEGKQSAQASVTGVLFDHDGGGFLELRGWRGVRDRAKRLGKFTAKTLKALLSGLRILKQLPCAVMDKVVGWAAETMAVGGVEALHAYGFVMEALGVTDYSAPDDATLEEFATCLKGPQTAQGCLGIAVGNRLPRRDHCYQVVDGSQPDSCPDVSRGSKLCDANHRTGCCNAAFVFEKVFMSDLRNMAPMPRDPASGPMPMDSQTVQLAGPSLPAGWSEGLSYFPALGAAACFMEAALDSSNPITLSVDPGRRCGKNETHASHVLEGTVEQCIGERTEGDEPGVYSTIIGTGTNTRWSGPNEKLGPILLGRVRNHFRDLVQATLAEVDARGMCCAGAGVLGGTATIEDAGGLTITAASEPDPLCSLRVHDDVPGAPPAPPNHGPSTGDPHLMTFDRFKYDMQGVGEFDLVRDETDGFVVQTRTAPYSSAVAVNVAVAAQVGADRIGFYRDGTVRLNAEALTLSAPRHELPDGGSLFQALGASFVVVWPSGDQLRVRRQNGFFNVDVFLADVRRNGAVEGMLGNFDGDPEGELITRDGRVLSPRPRLSDFYYDYVESWRVSQSASLFDYALGEDTETFTDRTFPGNFASTSGLLASAREDALAACESAGIHPDWTDSCVLDVALGDDVDLAQSFVGLSEVAGSLELELVDDPCTTASIPGYVVVDELEVPADGTLVHTAAVLGFGARYLLRASGTVTSALTADGLADAEYAGASMLPDEAIDLCPDGSDFGLSIDPEDDGVRTNVFGDFCRSNAYVTAVVGAGASLGLRYDDCDPFVSEGTLTVQILAPALACDGPDGEPDLSFVLYSNDFENPSGDVSSLACGGSVISNNINSTYGTDSFTYAQANTVEGLRIEGNELYVDPEGRGGKHAIGMLSTRQNDRLGLTFAAPDTDFLNVGFDLSSIDLSACGGPFGTSAPTMLVTAYDTPALPFSLGSPGTVLDQVTVAGVEAPSPWTFEWTYVTASLDVTEHTGGHVSLVFDLLQSGYGAFDNLSVVASGRSDVFDRDNDGVPDSVACERP